MVYDCVQVFYVDYGNSAELGKEELREMPTALLNTPFQVHTHSTHPSRYTHAQHTLPGTHTLNTPLQVHTHSTHPSRYTHAQHTLPGTHTLEPRTSPCPGDINLYCVVVW